MFPGYVGEILQKLESSGHSAYGVGGCVRDLLRGATPHDYDIATSARPEEVLSLFAPHAIPTGLQHGTVTVLAGTERVEVTTYRTEGAYSDGRRPDSVAFSTHLEDDLSRRDFTVNAMAMDARGQLVDLYGGQRDLKYNTLRCVGDADERFREDALRILRALRFAAVLDFRIEAETALAMERQAEGLRRIAAERVEQELTALLCGRAVERILLDYPAVLGAVLPEILPCVGFQQRNCHHHLDVWAHTARCVASTPPDPTLRWAALLHDLGKPAAFTVDEAGQGHFYDHGRESLRIAEDICHRLRFSTRERQAVCALVERHDRLLPPTEKAMGRLLHALGPELTGKLLALHRADNLAQHPAYRHRQQDIDASEAMLQAMLQRQQCFSLRQLAVNGHDLLALGYEGPQIGKALHTLLEEVLEGRLPNDREELLAYIQKSRP